MRHVLMALALVTAWTLAVGPAWAQSTEIARLLDEARPRAIEQVLDSSESRDPYLRANAMEAVGMLPERALPVVQMGLEDEHPAVRFAALVTMGRLDQEEAGDTVLAMMEDDASASVRAAARFAAHATGVEVDLAPLSTMLASPSPGLRSNVAILLAEMGDPSAVPMLAELARTPMPRADPARQALTRIQVAETMALLGDEASVDALRAGAYSELDEVRVLSVQALGRLEDRQMVTALKHILELDGKQRPPIEVRLAVVEALARMREGHRRSLPTVLEGAEMDEPPIQAQAAMTMALLPEREAAERLVELLEHDHEQVRLAAAAGILRAGEAPQRR